MYCITYIQYNYIHIMLLYFNYKNTVFKLHINHFENLKPVSLQLHNVLASKSPAVF